MELTLKATVVGCDTEQTKQVIRFAKAHNYRLTVDKQTVGSALSATYASQALQGDFRLIRFLIESELFYKVEISGGDRD